MHITPLVKQGLIEFVYPSRRPGPRQKYRLFARGRREVARRSRRDATHGATSGMNPRPTGGGEKNEEANP
jgi:DNA-binding PadR family transcriptional regulator